MPRIKRWFPVSQEINRDPQMWELCRRYGDRALRIWLELLSIADRLDGALPEPSPDLRRALADASRTSGQTVVKVWRILQQWSWITSSSPVRIANYAKYHKSREDHKFPTGSQPGTPPNLPNLSEPIKDKDNGITGGFELFWKAYPKKVGKGLAKTAWKKIPPANGATEKILKAIAKQRTWKAWKEGFIPLPATWLNQTRWEDEGTEDVKPSSPFEKI